MKTKNTECAIEFFLKFESTLNQQLEYFKFSILGHNAVVLTGWKVSSVVILIIRTVIAIGKGI